MAMAWNHHVGSSQERNRGPQLRCLLSKARRVGDAEVARAPLVLLFLQWYQMFIRELSQAMKRCWMDALALAQQ